MGALKADFWKLNIKGLVWGADLQGQLLYYLFFQSPAEEELLIASSKRLVLHELSFYSETMTTKSIFLQPPERARSSDHPFWAAWSRRWCFIGELSEDGARTRQGWWWVAAAAHVRAALGWRLDVISEHRRSAPLPPQHWETRKDDELTSSPFTSAWDKSAFPSSKRRQTFLIGFVSFFEVHIYFPPWVWG